MISVGVDIARLNIMAIEGQPKTTAEYIQASSRVGRETPGLVVVMYNTARSRDRSHYEQFLNYHSSLYRSVEVTSITPYSERARDRAFHAVYISLCRHLIDRLRDNDAASQFADNINGLDAIERYIADYVRKADPAEYDDVMKNIEEVKREWKFYLSDNLVYSANNSSGMPLLRSADDEAGVFETPNSMRNVDKSSNVYILEDE